MWRYCHIYQNVQELMLMPFDASIEINQQFDKPMKARIKRANSLVV